jgi:hypothetical protein
MTSYDIENLIKEIKAEEISSSIEIEFINNLFDVINKNRTIPIEYFNKNLMEISKTLTIKCDNIDCKRKALYCNNENNFCWIHSITNYT